MDSLSYHCGVPYPVGAFRPLILPLLLSVTQARVLGFLNLDLKSILQQSLQVTNIESSDSILEVHT